jgi:type II secretion system protein C
LAAFVLWNGGFSVSQVSDWLKRSARSTPHPVTAPRAILPEKAEETARAALEGTDASASSRPLPLILVSTTPGRNVHEGFARIGVTESNPQTYVAGALLSNGARLAEIHDDYVLLERGGRSARLNRLGLVGPAKRGDILSVGGARAVKTPQATSAEVITDYIRPSPVYDGAVLRGYEVQPGSRSYVFTQLGLQAGDVIASLNGVPLTDPDGAVEAFRQLTDGTAITAVVYRAGKRVGLSLDGALIVEDHERTSGTSAASGEAGNR